MNLVRRSLVFFLTIFVILTAALPPRAAQALDLRRPFTHYADQEELTSLLADFARSQGLNATFTPAVTGTASGRFEAVPAREFLDGMKAAFGVRWYEQGGTLHFYQESELTRAFLSPRVLSAASLHELLKNSSVTSPQLPVEMLSGGDMLAIVGPPAYLDQVRSAVAAFEEAQTGNFIMRVFPLKYAWAEDITVNSMDARVTIPGVASILRAMVSGQPLSGSRVTRLPAAQQSLAGQGLASRGQEGAAPAPASGEREADTPNAQTANIIADPRVNAVLVTDAEYRMPYYARVIEDLDKPVELVEIHAAIVDIDSSYQRDLGVNFQGVIGEGDRWAGGGDISSSSGNFNVLPQPGSAAGAGLTLSTLYTHGADFFLARVQALEENGDARVLGRPSVLTMDNIQATLENTTSYYIPVSGTSGDTALADLFKVDSGTVLKVTPHIIKGAGQPYADGRPRDSIKLVVSVQDDQNDDSSRSPDVGALPPIKQTKINTQAIVGEGQSLLIGGYYYERRSDTQRGVPGLMRIPLLGNLFRTSEKGSRRMERLILITPRVVRLDEPPAPPARVDDPRFHQTATQSHYEERYPEPRPATGGCSRRPAPITPPPVPVVSGASAPYSPVPAGVPIREAKP